MKLNNVPETDEPPSHECEREAMVDSGMGLPSSNVSVNTVSLSHAVEGQEIETVTSIR